VALTSITLSVTSRGLGGQPLGRRPVRFVLTTPWSIDQRFDACEIDGVLARVGDRVLLTAQPEPTRNGIFTLQLTRNGGGILVGFFNSAAPGDNFRGERDLADSDVVFATSGVANQGLWLASVGGPWTPEVTPIFFHPAPRNHGVLQRLIRFTRRLSSSGTAGFFGRAGAVSGPGVRYREALGTTSQANASLFVSPPVQPPP
jgi:hypothetical protein